MQPIEVAVVYLGMGSERALLFKGDDIMTEDATDHGPEAMEPTANNLAQTLNTRVIRLHYCPLDSDWQWGEVLKELHALGVRFKPLMTDAEYLQHGGSRCPGCNSWDVRPHDLGGDGGILLQPVTC